jgi:hypothetical protein
MIDLHSLIAPILTYRVPDGQDISRQICFSSDFFISGAANPAETLGSNTFAGVHAQSTFLMLHLWHREWTSPHDRDSNLKSIETSILDWTMSYLAAVVAPQGI